MPDDATPPELTARRLQALHEEGFVLLPGVLEAGQIAALRDAIDRLEPEHWDYTGLVDHYKCVYFRPECPSFHGGISVL